MSQPYDESFYNEQREGSSDSASGVIPQIFKIFKPESVIDIGCGIGTWLKVFKEKHGVREILGVDGEYVDKSMLQIDDSNFVSYDLKQVYTPAKRYDLALSLEVGEHLPDKCADNLVQSLINSSDFVMFSAAVPGQTGTYHINEQYPEYWAKKFIDRGYVCIDYIRKQIWDTRTIEFWYRQNTLLYVKKDVYESMFKEQLGFAKETTDPCFLTRIHPDMMLYYKGKFYQTKSLIGFLRYHLYPIKKMMMGGKK